MNEKECIYRRRSLRVLSLGILTEMDARTEIDARAELECLVESSCGFVLS